MTSTTKATRVSELDSIVLATLITGWVLGGGGGGRRAGDHEQRTQTAEAPFEAERGS